VQEGLSELAAATGKSVEKLLLAVCRPASEQREQTEAALKAGVPKLELALVQNGAALINEYHGKVLGRLTKLLALYGQAQAARLGLNIAVERREQRCLQLRVSSCWLKTRGAAHVTCQKLAGFLASDQDKRSDTLWIKTTAETA
jgi:hypothetical protein